MGVEKVLFYCFGMITLFAASMVITRRNPVYSALYLVMAFVSAAALWLLLEAEFLGIVLVLVYVGAVMVLFLFVVMMLNIDTATVQARFIHYLPLGLIIAGIMIFDMFLVLRPSRLGLENAAKSLVHIADDSNTAALGQALYTTYVYQFEIAAVILLVAIVAAIRLTLRRRTATKYQEPSQQVRVRKGTDRIRLVTLPVEPIPPSQTALLSSRNTTGITT